MRYVEKVDKTYQVWKRFFDLKQQKKVQWRSEKGCLWNVELKCNIKKTRTIACRMTGTNVRNKHRLRKTVSYKHDRFIKQKNKDSEEIVHRIVIIFFNFYQSAPDLKKLEWYSRSQNSFVLSCPRCIFSSYQMHTKCYTDLFYSVYFYKYSYSNNIEYLQYSTQR